MTCCDRELEAGGWLLVDGLALFFGACSLCCW